MLNKKQQSYLLCGALEGGSNYWYYLKQKFPYRDAENYPDYLTAVKDRKLSIDVYDYEDGTKLGTLTNKSLREACKLMKEKYPRHYNNVKTENDDADTADVFFQLAVMGELTYG